MKFVIEEIKRIETKLNTKCSNERLVKINVHYLLNTENLTDRECEIIKDLQKIPIHIFVNFSEPLFKQLCYLEKERVATFITALHWFYKIRFNKSHEIPVYDESGKKFNKGINIYKPWGSMYATLLDMCLEVYLVGKVVNIDVDEPYTLFKKVIFEQRNNWLFSPIKTDLSNSKKYDLTKEREKLEKLKDLINSTDETSSPYLYALLDTVISIYKSNIVANKIVNYYSKYLKSYSECINKIDKEFNMLTVHNGKVYTKGKGKSKILLSIS